MVMDQNVDLVRGLAVRLGFGEIKNDRGRDLINSRITIKWRQSDSNLLKQNHSITAICTGEDLTDPSELLRAQVNHGGQGDHHGPELNCVRPNHSTQSAKSRVKDADYASDWCD